MGGCLISKMDDGNETSCKELSAGSKKVTFDEMQDKKYTLDHTTNLSPFESERRKIHYIMDDQKDQSSDEKLHEVIDDILPTVRSVIMKNNEESPTDIIKLQHISKQEELWIPIIFRLINKIEIDDPLSASIISIFLEETPLPTCEQIKRLVGKMLLVENVYSEKIQRNILIIMSCLSEKVSGTSVATCINEMTIPFIQECFQNGMTVTEDRPLNEQESDSLKVLLYALICLERFSLSNQNRPAIMEMLGQHENNLLIRLSEWKISKNTYRHQIGFLSQYLLDNVFTPKDHVYDYLKLEENRNVRVMLNDEDTNDNLKISPDGMEARNDTLTFESVRSTCQVDSGVWYYEVTLLTKGIMQIGFASKSSFFSNQQGCGIGDDQYSVGYDGCRNLIWYNASHSPVRRPCWKEGDVIGLLLDIEKRHILFYINGVQLKPTHTNIFHKVHRGFFPAASFMSFQHALFNFGSEPFKYPPSTQRPFKIFNEHSFLAADKRVVLPKRVKFDRIKQCSIREDSCTLCYERQANTILIPCKHDLFCQKCVKRLANNCPVCRVKFSSYKKTTR